MMTTLITILTFILVAIIALWAAWPRLRALIEQPKYDVLRQIRRVRGRACGDKTAVQPEDRPHASTNLCTS